MSENDLIMRLLGTQVRALQQQVAILQAGQQQLPTLEQFEAGLAAIDGQFVTLGDVIAEKVTAAIGDHLAAIGARLAAIEAKLP